MPQNDTIKITIRQGKYIVNIEMPGNTHVPIENIAEIAARAKKEIDKMVVGHDLTAGTIMQDLKEDIIKNPVEIEPVQAVEPHSDDMFNIRKRLPNNVVDVSTLEINSTTNEKALIRCPLCGQSHVAVIIVKPTENYLMVYDSSKKEFIFVGDEPLTDEEVSKIILPAGSNTLDYYHDLLGMLPTVEGKPKDVIVYENTEIFCPLCEETGSFASWKDAYYKPLGYFEFENPCRVCGGETLEQVNKDSQDKKTVTHKCDSCGFEEEKEI